ncbi:uncharacterized protein LOC115472146 [Microcaecilia unicolor]|uniref:Uncharacterized protein LOC115472146 n=1 Tax=Microcaecilia unicolor TaxID=1415580 RepID=A0A6P7YB41_9AMPH|nr:uncharacterized protein LOC115472146 [Microcaecilia unicolor]
MLKGASVGLPLDYFILSLSSGRTPGLYHLQQKKLGLMWLMGISTKSTRSGTTPTPALLAEKGMKPVGENLPWNDTITPVEQKARTPSGISCLSKALSSPLTRGQPAETPHLGL